MLVIIIIIIAIDRSIPWRKWKRRRREKKLLRAATGKKRGKTGRYRAEPRREIRRFGSQPPPGRSKSSASDDVLGSMWSGLSSVTKSLADTTLSAAQKAKEAASRAADQESMESAKQAANKAGSWFSSALSSVATGVSSLASDIPKTLGADDSSGNAFPRPEGYVDLRPPKKSKLEICRVW